MYGEHFEKHTKIFWWTMTPIDLKCSTYVENTCSYACLEPQQLWKYMAVSSQFWNGLQCWGGTRHCWLQLYFCLLLRHNLSLGIPITLTRGSALTICALTLPSSGHFNKLKCIPFSKCEYDIVYKRNNFFSNLQNSLQLLIMSLPIYISLFLNLNSIKIGWVWTGFLSCNDRYLVSPQKQMKW